MLDVVDISKSFGAVRALDHVSASFRAGEIHAVLGENGAGKSTLMNILSGFATPDSGWVELGGSKLPAGKASETKRRGIAMIHQHFTLAPALTVAENLALARLTGLGPLNLKLLVRPAVELAQGLGWELDLHARPRELPVGRQQRVEILKALAGDPDVAIFDEPTAVLSAGEVEDIFRVLRRLRDAGKVVIVIAHKLAEVLAISDRVTVLRAGRVVAEAMTQDVDAPQLAAWMVGELPTPLQEAAPIPSSSRLVLRAVSAKGDRGESAIQDISIEVSGGEVLGIGGVDGNGQVELAEVLVGVRKFDGSIRGPKRIAYIPQDRQTDGLALGMSIEDNLLIVGHRRRELTTGPFLRRAAIAAWADQLIARFDIRSTGRREAVGSLSGGNQQKVVVARALDEGPELLVAVNPTRGLDVKVTDFVHRRILAARDAGSIVVLISTDHDELAALASRRVYLSRGRIREGDGPLAVIGG